MFCFLEISTIEVLVFIAFIAIFGSTTKINLKISVVDDPVRSLLDRRGKYTNDYIRIIPTFEEDIIKIVVVTTQLASSCTRNCMATTEKTARNISAPKYNLGDQKATQFSKEAKSKFPYRRQNRKRK